MQDDVLVFVIDMDHVSGEWEWEIPAGEAETVDDFGLWIFFGLVSGKTQSLANFIVYMAGIKITISKRPHEWDIPYLFGRISTVWGLSIVKQSSLWVAAQTFDNRLPTRLQSVNENRAV